VATVSITDYDQLSIGELARRLADTTSELVHKQIELAKQEAREDLRQNLRAAIILGVGAVLLLFAIICLLGALVAGTSAATGWPLWVCALLWFVIFAVIGAVLLFVGKQTLQLRPLGRTRAEAKENVEWVKQRLTPPAS
jgi:uncharacterized membrane protein YqjE